MSANTTLDPNLFGDSPARDERFTVKERWVECRNFPDGHPEKVAEFLHRQMNEEINGMEMAARGVSDFPDADWKIRMCIARQCSDEARHVLMFRRLCEKLGGWVGKYPVLNFQYRIVSKIDNLNGRLAVQNRSFEAGGIDAMSSGIQDHRNRGEWELVDLFEAQLADEIQHVHFANEWVRDVIQKDARNALRIARALTDASKAFIQVMGEAGTSEIKYVVDPVGRSEAGFEQTEVNVATAALNSRRSASRKSQQNE
ncbi:MAG TPA: DUF455 family protein [Terriglobia bacterium]|nr:DUF455 family protein [Terriglobia bacterium]